MDSYRLSVQPWEKDLAPAYGTIGRTVAFGWWSVYRPYALPLSHLRVIAQMEGTAVTHSS